jgi:hypothetical protein|tara:strand:+ start:1073 stop:1495 length:423 start_codon:yes stop_codon:yes gene_type:complete
MAHFAKISEENKVLSVHVVKDSDTMENGIEVESIGQAFLEKVHGWPEHLWKKTSYNTYQGEHRKGGTPYRGNYAGIGMDWDTTNEIFIWAKDYPSWTLNVSEARWQSPVGDPPALSEEDAMISFYKWNEATQAWDFIDNS